MECGAAMPGETELHKTLKKEACRWLYRMGYRCIAAEVRLPPVGIVDAIGTGVFRAYHNYLNLAREVPQCCFVECKASRADFLRDLGDEGQMSLYVEQRGPFRVKKRSRRKRLVCPADLGKFKTCLV